MPVCALGITPSDQRDGDEAYDDGPWFQRVVKSVFPLDRGDGDAPNRADEARALPSSGYSKNSEVIDVQATRADSEHRQKLQRALEGVKRVSAEREQQMERLREAFDLFRDTAEAVSEAERENAALERKIRAVATAQSPGVRPAGSEPTSSDGDFGLPDRFASLLSRVAKGLSRSRIEDEQVPDGLEREAEALVERLRTERARTAELTAALEAAESRARSRRLLSDSFARAENEAARIAAPLTEFDDASERVRAALGRFRRRRLEDFDARLKGWEGACARLAAELQEVRKFVVKIEDASEREDAQEQLAILQALFGRLESFYAKQAQRLLAGGNEAMALVALLGAGRRRAGWLEGQARAEVAAARVREADARAGRAAATLERALVELRDLSADAEFAGGASGGWPSEARGAAEALNGLRAAAGKLEAAREEAGRARKAVEEARDRDVEEARQVCAGVEDRRGNLNRARRRMMEVLGSVEGAASAAERAAEALRRADGMIFANATGVDRAAAAVADELRAELQRVRMWRGGPRFGRGTPVGLGAGLERALEAAEAADKSEHANATRSFAHDADLASRAADSAAIMVESAAEASGREQRPAPVPTTLARNREAAAAADGALAAAESLASAFQACAPARQAAERCAEAMRAQKAALRARAEGRAEEAAPPAAAAPVSADGERTPSPIPESLDEVLAQTEERRRPDARRPDRKPHVTRDTLLIDWMPGEEAPARPAGSWSDVKFFQFNMKRKEESAPPMRAPSEMQSARGAARPAARAAPTQRARPPRRPAPEPSLPRRPPAFPPADARLLRPAPPAPRLAPCRRRRLAARPAAPPPQRRPPPPAPRAQPRRRRSTSPSRAVMDAAASAAQQTTAAASAAATAAAAAAAAAAARARSAVRAGMSSVSSSLGDAPHASRGRPAPAAGPRGGLARRRPVAPRGGGAAARVARGVGAAAGRRGAAGAVGRPGPVVTTFISAAVIFAMARALFMRGVSALRKDPVDVQVEQPLEDEDGAAAAHSADGAAAAAPAPVVAGSAANAAAAAPVAAEGSEAPLPTLAPAPESPSAVARPAPPPRVAEEPKGKPRIINALLNRLGGKPAQAMPQGALGPQAAPAQPWGIPALAAPAPPPPVTLASVAIRFYGDPAMASRILAANPGLTPASFQPGRAIMLPERGAISAVAL
eukprot:tig00000571_g2153.t1